MMHKLFFDGACNPNPGVGSVGWVIHAPDGSIAFQGGQVLKGTVTNNVAEYVALALGLRACKQHGIRKVRCFGDSKLVVNQVLGKWKTSSAQMASLRDEILVEARGLDWGLRWVGRNQNAEADGLSRLALGGALIPTVPC